MRVEIQLKSTESWMDKSDLEELWKWARDDALHEIILDYFDNVDVKGHVNYRTVTETREGKVYNVQAPYLVITGEDVQVLVACISLQSHDNAGQLILKHPKEGWEWIKQALRDKNPDIANLFF